MLKLWVMAASALMGLGWAGLFGAPTASEDTKSAPKDDKAKVSADVGRDPADTLREVYVILKRLRADASVNGRPREWTDRAARYYREGVEAYRKGDLLQARTYSEVAADLASAIEFARKADQAEISDKELPQPPQAIVHVRSDPLEHLRVLGILPRQTMPPALPDEPGSDATSNRPRAPLPARGRLAIKQVRPTEAVRNQTKQDLAPSAPAPAPVPVAPAAPTSSSTPLAPALPATDTLPQLAAAPSDPQPLLAARRTLALQLRDRVNTLQDDSSKGDRKAQAELITRIAELQKALQDLSAPQAAEQARIDLKKAYDRIREARSQNPDPEAKFYLDAARDLYNAARIDAQTGRHARASELARAAEALTLVPKHLAHLPQPVYDLFKSLNIEPSTRKRSLERTKSDKAQSESKDGAKEEQKTESKKAGESPAAPKRRRAQDQDGASQGETKKRSPAGETGQAADEKVVGIGVALRDHEGEVRVEQILPGGPADRDGRIKIGDQVVGIADDQGEVVEFKGKGVAEIARLMRGPGGSKLKLVVKPKDSELRKTYTITREPLNLEASDLPLPPGGAGDPVRSRRADGTLPRTPGPGGQPRLPTPNRSLSSPLPPALPQ